MALAAGIMVILGEQLCVRREMREGLRTSSSELEEIEMGARGSGSRRDWFFRNASQFDVLTLSSSVEKKSRHDLVYIASLRAYVFPLPVFFHCSAYLRWYLLHLASWVFPPALYRQSTGVPRCKCTFCASFRLHVVSAHLINVYQMLDRCLQPTSGWTIPPSSADTVCRSYVKPRKWSASWVDRPNAL